MSSHAALEFTDAGFAADVLSSDVPVLVDFWAAWCAPCRAIAPTIEAVAAAWRGRVKVGKLDVDGNPETAAAYGIRTIPTLLLFHKGEVVDRIVGSAPRSRIEDMLGQRTAA